MFVNFGVLERHGLKGGAADEPEFAVAQGCDGRRARAAVDHRHVADDRARAENREDAFRALRRGHANFDQALIQPVAAVAGVARKKQDFIGRQLDRFCIGQQQIRQPFGQVRQ